MSSDEEAPVAEKSHRPGQSSSSRWNCGEALIADSMDRSSREDAMDVMRKRLRCGNVISEMYSPPSIAATA